MIQCKREGREEKETMKSGISDNKVSSSIAEIYQHPIHLSYIQNIAAVYPAYF